MPVPKKSVVAQPVQPAMHRGRTAAAAFFGFVAVGLIVASIVVLWLDRTLTNTDAYTKTVAPLVTTPGVQDFVAETASQSILQNKDVPVRDIAGLLLKPEQIEGKTDEQLKAEITPAAKRAVRSVIGTPQFAAFWEQQNRDIHAQVITQLSSDSPSLTFDLNPLIAQAVKQLDGTELAFLKDKVVVPPEAGKVTFEGKQLTNVRKGYKGFKNTVWLVVGGAIVASVLCVWLSVQHIRTFRRVAVLTAIFCGGLALLLSATSLFNLVMLAPEQKELIITLANGITHDLRASLVIVAIVCAVAAVATKVYQVVALRARSAVR